jgi:hypothetical protein
MILDELIKRFTEKYSHLADQDAAWGQCDVTTNAFIKFAYEQGYVGTLKQYTFWCDSEKTTYDQPNPAPEFYGESRNPYMNESGVMTCTWHCVIDAGEILIDFTARQYSKSLAFPLIIPIAKAMAAHV